MHSGNGVRGRLVKQPLHSLRISGFRALHNLEIPTLANVNLIVGKNSTGKTTVLEALRLLLTRDLRTRLYSFLVDRDEWAIKRWLDFQLGDANDASDVSPQALFSGRPNLYHQPRFTVSGGHNGPNLEIAFAWLRRETHEDASLRYVRTSGPEDDPEAIPGLIATSLHSSAILPLDRLQRHIARRAYRDLPEPNVVFLGSQGMTMAEIGRMWDSVALTDDEDHVVEALRIIAPSLEKLVMVQSPSAASERMLMAKISDFSSPIPFKSLGEGAIHLLSIALGAIQARGSVLLVDEIAAGIHYSVQPLLWKLIFDQSYKYDIQVFATTHSWDCIRALHLAGENYPSSMRGMLHRLEKDYGITRVTSFSSEELKIADAEEIEIR